MLIAIFLSICLFAFLLGIANWYLQFNNKKSISKKHVLISGGSSGIGLNVAFEAIKQGAYVTLFARDVAKLKSAEEELKSISSQYQLEERGKVQTFSGGPKKLITESVRLSEDAFGPVYMVVNCAGYAKAANFEDLPEDEVRNMMNVNYMGSFFLTQEVVGSMKKNEKGGVIVFSSSLGGLVGLFGYTSYSASKAALIRLAEALHTELKPFNISVTVCYPPDTDTPGFQEENKTKPVETKLISESAGVFKPDEVAKALINDSLTGKFSSSVGFEGFMLTTLCAGMGPVTNLFSLFCQVTLSGLFRLVSVFYLWQFDKIIKEQQQKRLKSKKVE